MECGKQTKFNFICIDNFPLSFQLSYSELDLEIKTFENLSEDFSSKLKISNSVNVKDHLKTYHLDLENIKKFDISDIFERNLSWFLDLSPFYFSKKELDLDSKINDDLISCQSIFIRNVDNKNIVIKTNPLEKIIDVKYKLQKKEGLEVDEQRLLFAGKQLEDNRALGFYNIMNDSTLHLVPRLRGGGAPLPVSFVDLESKKIKNLKFSTDAPRWRIVKQGLNIFGICENKKCKAFNKEVIFPTQKQVFDIILDCDLVKCPICDDNFIQKTCGFYQCSYTWSGMKKENRKLRKIKIQEWKETGEDFQYYDPEENGKSLWKLLKILTKPQGENCPMKCGVCMKDLISDSKKLSCQHSYHTECLDVLEYKLKIDCAMCR